MSLLGAPDPARPANPAAAAQYSRNLSLYTRTAQHWTALYAGGKLRVGGLLCIALHHSTVTLQIREFEQKAGVVEGLGLGRLAALTALSACDWDLRKTEDLIESGTNQTCS